MGHYVSPLYECRSCLRRSKRTTTHVDDSLLEPLLDLPHNWLLYDAITNVRSYIIQANTWSTPATGPSYPQIRLRGRHHTLDRLLQRLNHDTSPWFETTPRGSWEAVNFALQPEVGAALVRAMCRMQVVLRILERDVAEPIIENLQREKVSGPIHWMSVGHIADRLEFIQQQSRELSSELYSALYECRGRLRAQGLVVVEDRRSAVASVSVSVQGSGRKCAWRA